MKTLSPRELVKRADAFLMDVSSFLLDEETGTRIAWGIFAVCLVGVAAFLMGLHDGIRGGLYR